MDEIITHKSARKQIPQTVAVLETTNKNGIKCVWSGNFVYHPDVHLFELRFSWSFDWSELKKIGVSGLSGHITVTSPGAYFDPQQIDVDLTANPQLLPYRHPFSEEVSYDEMFLPSQLNDTVLVIDERKLNVNRMFLSYHSDFFQALFSSKFKEGQMDEIPIEDVSYADFGLLMSTIYPKTVFPNDKTVEKLLELADRFLVPSVIGHVEYHLLHNTRINSEKIIWMADKYGMPKLFKKCLDELNTNEKAKKLHTSPEYKKLSQGAKAEILDIVMKMI
ncbi:unnamed protein product [Caenorhabditis brenneri]